MISSPDSVKKLLLLQKSDIDFLKGNLDKYSHLEKVVIDPGIMERALAFGISGLNFKPFSPENDFNGRIGTEATSFAYLLDLSISNLRKKFFNISFSSGWDFTQIRFIALRSIAARERRKFCEAFLDSRNTGLFRPTRSGYFYFDSFIPISAFLCSSNQWKIIGEYNDIVDSKITDNCHIYDFSPFINQRPQRAFDAIVHIPTLSWHHEYFITKIQEKFDNYLELPSQSWDVPIGEKRLKLINWNENRDLLPSDLKDFRNQHVETIRNFLKLLHVTDEDASAQADSLADFGVSQILNYFELKSFLQGTTPEFIICSHDTGSQGPIFSVAAELGANLTVLPHSSYPNHPLPHKERVTALELANFKSPIRTIINEKVKTKEVSLEKKLSSPSIERYSVRNICLLLNGSEDYPIDFFNLAGLIESYDKLKMLCESHDIKLVTRLKPNSPGLLTITSLLRQTVEDATKIMKLPLKEVAANSDVCISFGQMTSGVYDFFMANSLVLWLCPDLQPSDLISAPDLCMMGSLEMLDITRCTAYLERLIQDPLFFYHQLKHQQTDFDSRKIEEQASDFWSHIDSK